MKSLVTGFSAGKGFFMSVMMWLAMSGFILTRRNFGIRLFSINYLLIPALFIIFKGAFKPFNVGMFTLTVPAMPSLFYFHQWAVLLVGSYHYIKMHIRERKGIVVHSYFVGHPHLMALVERLPFVLSQNRVKRFVEPGLVFVLAQLFDRIDDNYGLYLELVSLSMFVVANLQHRAVRSKLWDIQDAEIESEMLMATKDSGDSTDEIFDAYEGKTFEKIAIMNQVWNDADTTSEDANSDQIFKAN